MNVPLLDLKLQYASIKDECLKVTEDIYNSQHFILGPHVEALESEISSYCGAAYAVGVSSGTDALLISLMAAGVGNGDKVLTSPYTFFATAGAVARVGAIPVFVDIDPDTYNLSLESLNRIVDSMPAEEKRRVKAIIPVHLYGQCADMDEITAVAQKNEWLIIEDAAQAIGAEYKGKRAGSLGDFGCFSFFPSKNLGGFGDGGIVTTGARQFYDMLVILRVHGGHPKYYHRYIGGNFRLDALQAAIVSIKLKHLDTWTAGRQANAERYRRMFENEGLTDYIKVPAEKHDRHIYNQFVIEIPGKRDQLKDFLLKNSIGCEIYYPVPLHLQACFSYLGYKNGDFPNAEYAAGHSLAIPVYPELTESQQSYVVETIKAFRTGAR
ncbi:MAG: DegT/DnrJ/EryC1/StrS family aminotransferase [Desulfosalsimonadaceae bacterium]